MPEMTPEEAHTEAIRRIREAREGGSEMLDLGDLPMTELPEELGTLTGLKALSLGKVRLECKGNELVWEWDDTRPDQPFTNLEPLGQLTELTFLDLTKCWKLQDLEPLGQLTALTSLNLSWCGQLRDVEVLGQLTRLTSLDLSGCEQLQDLEPLGQLTALTSLDLSRREQLQDLEPLGQLTRLTSLDLSRCEQLRDVEVLGQLTRLTSLDLSRCRGFAFEPIRMLLPTLENLYLGGSQLSDLPPELCDERSRENVITAVRAYYADLDFGAASDAEVKTFVLGNGCVGKTQLIRCLKEEPFQREWNSTHGIQLNEHSLKVPGLEHPVRLNLWDFGGQDI